MTNNQNPQRPQQKNPNEKKFQQQPNENRDQKERSTVDKSQGNKR